MEIEVTTQQQGVVVWDSAHGHVCSCARTENFDAIGAPTSPTYAQTVELVAYTPLGRPVYAPEGRRLWRYRCRTCGASIVSDR